MSNPLLAYLDVVGLPWRLSRVELAKRHGVRRHPAFRTDVVEMRTKLPFVEGLLWPLAFGHDKDSPVNLPPASFFGHARIGDDARANVQAVLRQLQPVLGPGEPAGSANTVGHRWAFGRSSLELTAWPGDLAIGHGGNPALDREPRLRTACTIGLTTGWRPATSAADRAQLDSFEPVVRVFSPESRWPAPRSGAAERLLEYWRESTLPDARRLGWVGRSADHACLVFFGPDLMLVPMAEVLRVEVTRVQPARGPGGSTLSLALAGGWRSLPLCDGDGPDDLSDLGAALAAGLSRPLVLQPYAVDN